jgi:hypothetical protein
VVVGAGVAGLACAAEARRAGLDVVVVERARGVGGRCATRRVDGQAVDFGLCFLHGATPEFLEALRAVPATARRGWPQRLVGEGPPCQPDAFLAGEERLAFAQGVSAFPKHLAEGLDVRLRREVAGLSLDGSDLHVRVAGGESLRTPTVVLAMATEQARALLAPPLGLHDEVRWLLGVLDLVASVPSLAVLAGYPEGTPPPPWDISYPQDSRVIALASHDSAKREAPRQLVVVFQTRPRHARGAPGEPGSTGAHQVLEEAGRLYGPWAARPAWAQAHRWDFARVDRGNELAAPVLLTLPGGVRVGVAGEVFSPGGGVEAAFLSGRALGRRVASGA